MWCGDDAVGSCLEESVGGGRVHENKIAEVWMDRNGRRREIVKFVSVCQGGEGEEMRQINIDGN